MGRRIIRKLLLCLPVLCLLLLSGCGRQAGTAGQGSAGDSARETAAGQGTAGGTETVSGAQKTPDGSAENADWPGTLTGSLELSYATCFSADFYGDGLTLVTVNGSDRYLLAAEGAALPAEVPAEVTVIRTPVKKVYLAASSAMDLFRGLDALGSIVLTSTKESDWTLPAVREAMEAGSIRYAGKYSAPDYEAIVSEGCDLAVESTMIGHSPEVKEQLERLGLPVLTEYSSYEAHPLGRMEWIKLYGLLTGKSREAEAFFEGQVKELEAVLAQEDGKASGKTAAFFYLTSNGHVNVRKPGDYISRMIELAGGQYAFTADDLKVDKNALSTMNLQFETFYALAKDADVLIYNSTVAGGPKDLRELTAKNALLADFKAVKSGDVWCTEQNLFQETTGAARMIEDLCRVLGGSASQDAEALTYLYRLE